MKILKEYELIGFFFFRVDGNVGVYLMFKFNDLDLNFKRFSFIKFNGMINNVFDVVDFLNISLKDYIDDS